MASFARIDVPVAVVEGQPVLRPRGTANHSAAWFLVLAHDAVALSWPPKRATGSLTSTRYHMHVSIQGLSISGVNMPVTFIHPALVYLEAACSPYPKGQAPLRSLKTRPMVCAPLRATMSWSVKPIFLPKTLRKCSSRRQQNHTPLYNTMWTYMGHTHIYIYIHVWFVYLYSHAYLFKIYFWLIYFNIYIYIYVYTYIHTCT